ncbi:MAG: PLDc N-terminal domain-containing protein [Candidatus Pacearchaeota archaeon]|nr:PLDc N-terminal domain-containing protein [Candidatus Pacearchaeota archaeon]
MEIILILAAIFLLIAISIAAFVFWIMMLIDSIKRKFKNDTEKIVWVLVIILTGILGAIIYYFVAKRK